MNTQITQDFEVLDILLPEDGVNDPNLIKMCSLQQYKLSTQISSNISSQTILKEAINSNYESVASKYNELSKCVKNLLQNTNTCKSKTWETALSNIDPISLFEKSLQKCGHCDHNNQTRNTDTTQFLNNKCSCSFAIYNTEKFSSANNSTKILSHASYDNVGDEHRKLYRPKFTRTKLPKTTNSIETSHTPIYPNVEFIDEEEAKAHKSNVAKITFKTAREQLLASNPGAKRTLGASRKAHSKFVSPMIGAQEKQESNLNEYEVTDERLKHIDPKMIELIESEIIDKGNAIGWDDIAGLEMAKSVIQETVVWPLLRPDIFKGLRRPPKGILLFGPPGTGKTLIGKCVAAQCNATFFSISASSLTSKWLGDAEKMVRALFAVARCHQPAVIFIDEIDSLLTQRSDSEHEATRRIKTEFLVQFDGAATGDEDRLLIVGATNRPQELDEAARRRLVKRLYIPLPNCDARKQIVVSLLKEERHSLSDEQMCEVSRLSEGFSGADVRALCHEAALGPLRALPPSALRTVPSHQVRPVSMEDFKAALQRVRPSVSQDDLGQYEKWNQTYGQGF